jgi:hypothetical protein
LAWCCAAAADWGGFVGVKNRRCFAPSVFLFEDCRSGSENLVARLGVGLPEATAGESGGLPGRLGLVAGLGAPTGEVGNGSGGLGAEGQVTAGTGREGNDGSETGI